MKRRLIATASVATVLIGSSVSAQQVLAGKTCRGEYHYNPGHDEKDMGAILFKPDAAGKARLYMWLGRSGMEQYKTAPQSKYRDMGEMQIVPKGADFSFIHPLSKKLYEFASSGNGYKLTLHQNDGGTSEGKLECQ